MKVYILHMIGMKMMNGFSFIKLQQKCLKLKEITKTT